LYSISLEVPMALRPFITSFLWTGPMAI